MRASKRFVGFALLVFCLASTFGQRRALAMCSSGEIYYFAGCGCSGWIGVLWDAPELSCTGGGPSEDALCAAGICNDECEMPLHEGSYQQCQNNQWGSWLGFKCGNACS